MKYIDARLAIRSGDALAWTHRGWNSWYDFKVQMVRVFTQSEYCHVGIAWVVAGRVFILEAVTAGIRIFPLSKELPFYWIPTSADWTETVEQYAMDQMGEPYSQWLAVQSFLGRENKSDEGTWQCAKYAKAVLTRLGFSLPGRATPSEVVHDLQALDRPVFLVEADDAK